MTGPIIRIILRYGVGILVTKGMLDYSTANDLASDQDVIAIAQMAAGALIGVGTEVYYALARKWGWAK
jgi:hypothetical protein